MATIPQVARVLKRVLAEVAEVAEAAGEARAPISTPPDPPQHRSTPTRLLVIPLA